MSQGGAVEGLQMPPLLQPVEPAQHLPGSGHQTDAPDPDAGDGEEAGAERCWEMRRVQLQEDSVPEEGQEALGAPGQQPPQQAGVAAAVGPHAAQPPEVPQDLAAMADEQAEAAPGQDVTLPDEEDPEDLGEDVVEGSPPVSDRSSRAGGGEGGLQDRAVGRLAPPCADAAFVGAQQRDIDCVWQSLQGPPAHIAQLNCSAAGVLYTRMQVAGFHVQLSC